MSAPLTEMQEYALRKQNLTVYLHTLCDREGIAMQG